MDELIYAYTRNQAIKDGVLMLLDDFFTNQLKDIALSERMRFSEAMGKLRQECNAKFPLGELVITANAAAKLDAIQALTLLVRHESGNWGNVCEEDWQWNDRALEDGTRLFSVYEIEDKEKCTILFYVITDWNREATTIMLPEDY